MMKAPAHRVEISEAWVEFMLRDYINRHNPQAIVTIKSFNVSNATKPGDGYSGDLCLLDIQAHIDYCDGDNGDLESKKAELNNHAGVNNYSFIVKLANPNVFFAHMQTVIGQNMREFKIYSEVIQELNKFQREKTSNQFPIIIPEYIYGKCSNDEFVLVMENMKQLDYVTNPKKSPINLHQSKKVLEQQARVHAVSYAYNNMHNLLVKYPCLKPGIYTELLTVGMPMNLDLAIEYLESINGQGPLIKKIRAAKSNVVKTCKDSFKNESNYQIMCLMHGDSWNNNFLFKQKVDENGGKSVKDSDDVMLIDWQISHWNTPVADLSYFFHSSTSPTFRKTHIDELLKYYHTIFTEITIKLGTPVPHWTFDQLKKEYDQMKVFGFLRALTFAGIHSDAGTNLTLGDVQTGVTNPVINSIKKGIAKAMVPLMLRPSILEAGMKKMLNPVREELLSGKNQLFCDLFLEILIEAEQNGIFEAELYNTDESENVSRSLKCI
ncbi:unnamed protein product [Meganyctiphanes norvegica]|uniref:CHK kinase-like domain-containing protein n=1 Tax=Meganyctiphanes norvegica TaxID=48144 RepID=A0AAV2RCG5_MEGNR